MFGLREDKNSINGKDLKTLQIAPAPKINYTVPPPMHNGHKLYEANMETGVLEEVKYKSRMVDYLSKDEVKVYIPKKNCRYIPALNEKNALAKLFKLQKHFGQNFIDTTPKKNKANATA